MDVRPFPFASLESLTRAEVAAAATLRRVASTYVRLDAMAAAMGELVGERVEVLVRKLRRADTSRGADDAVGVMLAPAEETRASTRRVLVEAEGALAAQIVARALKQRAPRVTDASRAASPAVAGAVAAVLSAALRRAHNGAALRVVAAGPGHVLARDLAASSGELTTAWLTVVIGSDAFEARVTVPDGAEAPRAPFDRSALLALGDAPLALPLVAARCLVSRNDIARLARGDAFVPPREGLFAQIAAAGGLAGPVALVAPASERGLGADLAPDGRLVVRGLLESHRWDADMSDTTATVEALEDAPVVVRVELGAVELPAREWAALAPGDVLTLGRKLGDPAILRVAGVEVARGELVIVDGEYAVRVVSRAGDAK